MKATESIAAVRNSEALSRVTVLTRWFVIIIVCFGQMLYMQNNFFVIGLIAGSIGFNLLHYFPIVRRLTFTAPFLMGLIDFYMLFLLLNVTGGLNSPFYFFAMLPLAITASWFGWKVFVKLAVIAAIVTALIVIQAGQTDPESLLRAAGYIATLGIAGYIIDQLTLSGRNERLIAMAASETAETERIRLLSLINSMSDAVVATDKRGNVTHYNAAALDLLNINTGIAGKQIADTLELRGPEGAPVNILREVLATAKGLQRSDLQLMNNNGEKINLFLHIAPIIASTSYERDRGFIFVMRDITKEKSLDAQRDEFIAVVSHELRTPLAIAEANISTALLPQVASDFKPQVRDLMTQAHDNIVFLGHMVTDLTTLAAAEDNMLEIHATVLNPGELLQKLAKDSTPRCTAKGLKLQVEIADHLPVVVNSEQHIREILQNFTSNAIKYTKQGSITLRVTAKDDMVVFGVADTGIGISASDQKHLFSKFYRSEDYRTRETGGTGLGLYITQKLASRLGVRVWFESTLNKGSTFYLEVPPHPAKPQP